jgi:hypothetical protein
VTAFFVGSYVPGGVYSLAAGVNNFGSAGVLDIFKHLTGGSLDLPKVDIAIGSATFEITSAPSLTITVSGLTVSSFTALDTTLQISDTGAMIKGQLDSSVSLGDISVTKPFIQVSFGKSASGKTSEVALGGEVQFEGITIDAAVHLYQSADGSKKIEWTIIGAMSSSGDLSISSLVSELKVSLYLFYCHMSSANVWQQGSFLDGITLRNASFIVASKDDPALGAMLPKPYPIHQGQYAHAQRWHFSIWSVQEFKCAPSLANFKLSMPLRGAQLPASFSVLDGLRSRDLPWMLYYLSLQLSALGVASPPTQLRFRFKQSPRCCRFKLVSKFQFPIRASRCNSQV